MSTGFPFQPPFFLSVALALQREPCCLRAPSAILLGISVGRPSADWKALSTNEMKSLRFAEFGPPSVLRIEELPVPEPGDGGVLVHVRAAAINPSAIGNVAGRFKKTTCVKGVTNELPSATYPQLAAVAILAFPFSRNAHSAFFLAGIRHGGLYAAVAQLLQQHRQV